MVKELKYGGRNVKIVENIDFRLIWQFQEVIGQKLLKKNTVIDFFDPNMGPNTLIYFCFNFLEIFKKLTLVNIFVRPWRPKVSSVTLFVSLPLKNFKTIFKFCVSGIQAIYLTYMWSEKHWNISNGLDRN